MKTIEIEKDVYNFYYNIPPVLGKAPLKSSDDC